MKYNLPNHGDFLEKHFAEWVGQRFPYYEKVWSLYVGHQGNGIMAELPSYPDQDKRVYFAEHSYTILQSLMVANSIIESKIFEQPHNDIATVIEFHKSLVAFYAFIGRINDCTKKIASKIGLSDIAADLQRFYDERNVILHGKTIPLSTDDVGFIRMPAISMWDDKRSRWSDGKDIPNDFAGDTIQKTFDEIVNLLNGTYARIYSLLKEELNGLELLLETSDFSYLDVQTSGSTSTVVTNYSLTSDNKMKRDV